MLKLINNNRKIVVFILVNYLAPEVAFYFNLIFFDFGSIQYIKY